MHSWDHSALIGVHRFQTSVGAASNDIVPIQRSIVSGFARRIETVAPADGS